MASMRARTLSEADKQRLLKQGIHVEHIPHDLPMAQQPVTKMVKTLVEIPHEEIVKVPVIRKEKRNIVEQQVIKGSKLVPVTKYREVEEINLQDQHVSLGQTRNSHPDTQLLKTYGKNARTRKIPYTDYEMQEVDIVVNVPREVVQTRVGYRLDKHVHTKAVELEEEHVYEMRPVLVRKGETKANELTAREHHGKAVHGEPVWDGPLHEGWHPELGSFSPSSSRPGTSRLGGSAGPGAMEVTGSPTGRLGSALGSRSALTRSAPNLLANSGQASFGNGGQGNFGGNSGQGTFAPTRGGRGAAMGY